MNETVKKRYYCSVISIKNTIEKFNRIHASGQISICHEIQCTPDKRYIQNIIAQAKLELGQSGDVYEQEADRVAAAIVQMSETEIIQTKELFQKNKIPIRGIGLSLDLESRINLLKGGGMPLPTSIRTFFESHFGCDFSHVRIHTDAEGEEIAQVLNARAFTTGYDLVFAAGQYSPWTMDGQMLLAHELVHVIQQTGDCIISSERTEYIQCAGNIGPILQAVIHGEKVIRKGDKGPAVKIIQQALISAGVPLPRFGADSDFGSETESAVRKFQKLNGLLTNGIIDFNTIRKLAMIFPPLAAFLPETPPTVTPLYPVPPSPTHTDGFWYTVKIGDWLDGIAKRNSLSSWKDIYYHEKNKAYREKRPDPNKIFPGDQLWIPKKPSIIEFTQPVINEFFGRLIDYDNLQEKPHNLILPMENSIVLHWNVEHAEHIKIQSMTLDGTISYVPLPENGKVPDISQANIGKVTILPVKSTTFTLFAMNKSGTSQYYRHVNVLLYKRSNMFNSFSVDVGPDYMDLLESSSIKPTVLLEFNQQVGHFHPDNAGLRKSGCPEMLEFIETKNRLNIPDLYEPACNDAVRLLLQMEGFGFFDKPKGRRDAYIDILFWGKGEKEIHRKSYEKCPKNGSCLHSSCGLVVRSLWLLLGARDVPGWGHKLNPPYRIGMVMSDLRNFANKCGALHQAKSNNGFKRNEFLNLKPSIGDAIFIWKGNKQHVFTLIDVKGNKFISIDGGQDGCKGEDKCCGIKRRERILTNETWARFSNEERPIMALVKFDKLIDSFVAPMVELVKNKANYSGIGPCPPDPMPNPGEFIVRWEKKKLSEKKTKETADKSAKDAAEKIAKCEAVHSAYKALSCAQLVICKRATTKAEVEARITCLTAEIAGR